MKTSPAAARKTLPIIAAKLESTAQIGAAPLSPITESPKSWLARGRHITLKMKEETVGEKKRTKKKLHKLCQLPTSLAALTDQLRKGKAHLHLIFLI